MKQSSKKTLTLKTINKSNIWDVQENDIFRMWQSAEKDADIKDNTRHYTDIISSAFDIEILKIDKPEIRKKFEERGFKIGQIKFDDNNKVTWAVKKRPILRVTDLTYENIRHISAAKLLEVIDRNFGGGWESLSQSIRDIIESGFDVSTSTLPKDCVHSGMYQRKVADGFEVLEISKGNWVESIFAKEKPEMERPKLKIEKRDEDEIPDDEHIEEDEEEQEEEPNFDDSIDEDTYRTTFDIGADPNGEAEEISDLDEEE